MSYGTINADVIGTSVAGSSLGAGDSSLMKSRIINGAMVISQRNGTSSVSATSGGQYFLDRWATGISAGSKFTVAQSSSAPTGFNNSSLITSSTAWSLGSSDYATYYQYIEGYNVADLGYGTANAKTVTLSFWVQSSLTGTFGGVLSNSSTRFYPFTYTISSANTWEQKTVTIAGDTTGTWSTTTSVGMSVLFSLAAGSSLVGTPNAWTGAAGYQGATGQTNILATNGATWQITGVQLEVGSSATGYEYRQYGTELALCQRYFQQYGDNATNKNVIPFAQASGTTEIDGYMTLPVVMRTTPTLTSLNLTAYDSVSTPIAMTGGTVYNASNSVFGAYWTVSVVVAYRPYMIRTYTSAGYMQLSAEL
jgi:hypothetical protein